MKRLILVGAVGAVAACGPKGPELPPVKFISPPGALHQAARFSPDGSRLFWWTAAGPVSQLWMGPPDLHDSTKVPVTSVAGGIPILWSPDGSQIAVPLSTASFADVAVIPANGGAPRQITHVTGFAFPTSWNPDGKRLSFMASAGGPGAGAFQTFVTSVDQGGSAPMLPGESRLYYAVWSPDGRRIAYNVTEGSKNTIWVADSAGGNRRQLTTDGFELFGNGEFVWSPDSREIAYESRRTGTSDIWVVPADSGSPRQLTKDIRNDFWPIWSPDGKWIAFRSDRGKQTDLWVVPAAGGVERRITNDAAEEEPLQWRKGTNELAYLTGETQSAIVSIALATGAETRLTPDSIRAVNPHVSPDGKQILFRINRGGGVADLAVMPMTGGPWRVVVQGGNNSGAVWSPDGSHIAFQSDRGGTYDIWVVDAAGGEPRQLENWPGTDATPVWNADGSAIYFLSDHDAKLNDVWQVPVSGGEPKRVTTSGLINNYNVSSGRREMFASMVDPSGRFIAVRINPDGTGKTIWNRGNSFVGDQPPGSDSVLVAVAGTDGTFTMRLVPGNGGDGKPIVDPGDGAGEFSRDGTKMIYYIPAGTTNDIAILNRKDGTTRRLTTTPENEGGGSFTPDGQTVVFFRSRAVRRIAVADLTKLLATPP